MFLHSVAVISYLLRSLLQYFAFTGRTWLLEMNCAVGMFPDRSICGRRKRGRISLISQQVIPLCHGSSCTECNHTSRSQVLLGLLVPACSHKSDAVRVEDLSVVSVHSQDLVVLPYMADICDVSVCLESSLILFVWPPDGFLAFCFCRFLFRLFFKSLRKIKWLTSITFGLGSWCFVCSSSAVL